MKKVSIIFLLTIVFVVFFLTGLDIYKKAFRPYKGYGDSITVQIDKGSSVVEIGKLLYQKKIIASYAYFTVYYRLFFSKLTLQSGEYHFNTAMTPRQVIQKLNLGKIVLHKITIKEGMTIEETGEFLEQNHRIDYDHFIRIAKNEILISDIDPEAEDLEGYLFPETYLVPRSISAEELIKLMIQKFREKYFYSMYIKAQDFHFSTREVITLASLIEKETAAREERFLISSVFHNRLKSNIPLACDPTIIFILKKQNRYTGDLRWKDLEIDSPYNTRENRGLPPGPICSPGSSSIEAALQPAITDYLYFVANSTRTHYFSKTLKEHNWAVRKYIINRERYQ